MSARVLIVEDERAIQLALSGLLRREGYEVEVAASGEEAASVLADHRWTWCSRTWRWATACRGWTCWGWRSGIGPRPWS